MAAPRFAPWEPAPPRCSGRARNGARALMLIILTLITGLKNWGIYDCRDTALGNRSVHGDGRALDVGCSLAVGRRLLRKLLDIDPARLGIAVIIHEGRIYSAKSPRGRPYTGHPHHDHLHIELTRAAANTMTAASIRRILTSSAPAAPAKPKPIPAPRKPGSRMLKPGSKGADVVWLQKKLNIKADGIYGERTEARVKRWQRRHDLPVDGGIGPKDWRELLGRAA